MIRVKSTYHTLGGHQVETTLNDGFVEFHAVKLSTTIWNEDIEIDLLGNTVHEKTTHAVIAVVNGHIMSSLVELVSTCKSRRARTYDSNSFSSAESRGVWLHPTHLEALRRHAY